MHTYHIHIKGLVQGVGFRPFIYRLANEIGLSGEVRNNNNGVCIEINSTNAQKEMLLQRVQKEKPAASLISRIDVKEYPLTKSFSGFSIASSQNLSEEITHISPDIAVCDDCLRDMKMQSHRKNYPFINCTNCGPRFSIISDLPYDRESTSMKPFKMCSTCSSEYSLITDRRFHAQPVACNSCGPYYYLHYQKEEKAHTFYCTPERFVKTMCDQIRKGEVVSLKGLGGYNLICDAFCEKALERLRKIKQRDQKPFAMLFPNLNKIKAYAFVSKEEEEMLLSWRRPIVILKLRNPISKLANGGLNSVGVMLPYLPVHYLFFEKLSTDALILTSGNLSDEPIIISNETASKKLLPLTNLQGEHNRVIVNRMDDSIVQFINHKPMLIRRSRGFVPDPHSSTLFTEGILAFGAEKVNTFALGKNNEMIVSQYIGDLKNPETLDFYKEAMSRFQKLFKFIPKSLVCDLHPDYFSTRRAEEIAENLQLPLYKVQHHHAHAVAAMEEFGLTDDCLAIVMDGTGYGTDRKIWGSEFLICNHKEFVREAHFPYVALPGGDMAVKQPWRSAIAYLDHYGHSVPEKLLARYGEQKQEMILKMVHQDINAPLSCGAGRLFDAVSSILGLCDTAHFQAEAPMRLEHAATDNYADRYETDMLNPLNFSYLFNGILEDLEGSVSTSLIAAKFHNTLSVMIGREAELILENYHIPRKVVLSGGCFQNKRIAEQVSDYLNKKKIQCYLPEKFPVNDGGISLGQLAIAATKRVGKYA
ncbi:MAG: carbamoyltransferase HypF [Bacteroidales bacterium]